ncbi:MAG TPA: ABC transporter substrate-binding protein, partial [Thermoanaerobaculia bacterium]|nr:ABC transporter substrate-binding protein [Thermoanaerobaculia bacterium]
ALESAPIQFDPRVASDQASSRVFELAMNGLVSKDETGTFVPDLAESWEVLDGGRRWRFHLRDGVRFHDGSTFDADDVVWTYGSLVDGSVTSAKRGSFARVERVAAVDSRTVDFETGEPFGALLGNLTSYVGVVPSGRTPEQQNREPVGTGPFRVGARSPDRVELLAFDGFFRGRPRLDRIVLREVPDATVRVLELRKGTVQLGVNAVPPDVVPLFESDPRFRVVEKPGANYAYLGVNFEDPALADPRVRRALLLSLDRERLVRTLWRGLGTPTETMLPPGHWARHDGLEGVPHDPAAARRLLDQAGFPDPDGPEGPAPRLTLTYKTSTDETALLQAQILQAMAAEAGIRLEIRSHEFATFFQDIQRGVFQIFSLTRTGIDDPDIYALVFHSRNVPPAGANRGRYRNPELDRLLDLGSSLADPAERRPVYLAIQETVARDLPYLSLFSKTNVAVMPRELEGFRMYPSGELLSLREVGWRTDAAQR